jgi:hypothetical protein
MESMERIKEEGGKGRETRGKMPGNRKAMIRSREKGKHDMTWWTLK